MGKGRKPCCDKSGVKKGPWSQGEDLKLISFIQKHGHSNWRALPKLAGLARCGKSCRLRWVNYLRPDLKRGDFTPQEEDAIIKLHQELGNKWSKIASKFSGRTDNEIKNVWNTHLKKRLKAKESNKTSQESYSSVPTSTSTDEPCVESSKDTTEHSSSSSSYTSNPPFSKQILEDVTPMLDDNALDELFEIPFDPDIDIWELLDGDQPNSANLSDVNFTEGDNSINIVHEIDNLSNNINNNNNNNNNNNITINNVNNNNINVNNNVNNDNDGENWWWLVYLENELGLNQDETNII